jgi:hypothetical protein
MRLVVVDGDERLFVSLRKALQRSGDGSSEPTHLRLLESHPQTDLQTRSLGDGDPINFADICQACPSQGFRDRQLDDFLVRLHRQGRDNASEPLMDFSLSKVRAGTNLRSNL